VNLFKISCSNEGTRVIFLSLSGLFTITLRGVLNKFSPFSAADYPNSKEIRTVKHSENIGNLHFIFSVMNSLIFTWTALCALLNLPRKYFSVQNDEVKV